MYRRLLQTFMNVMDVDDIARARVEEAVSTSARTKELKGVETIGLKEERLLKQMLAIVSDLLANASSEATEELGAEGCEGHTDANIEGGD